jgi:phosphocarrier protein
VPRVLFYFDCKIKSENFHTNWPLLIQAEHFLKGSFIHKKYAILTSSTKAHSGRIIMIQQTVTINRNAGLYAQPVNKLVQHESRFNADIFLTYKGRKVNVKSVLGVLSLAIPKQAEIILEASGDDEIEALKEVIHRLEMLE